MNQFQETNKYIQQFEDLINELRTDLKNTEDLQAKAMLETSAEVISGLRKTFQDFDLKEEAAWQ